jgi:hypothetical protein
MGPGRRLLACLFVGTLSLGAHAADEPLPIKVRRPVRGGDSFNVHMVFEQTRRETALPPATSAASPAVMPAAPASAPAPLERVLKADLTCRVDVLDVDRQGHTSAWVTVSRFLSLIDNREIVPAGKIIGILNDDMDMYVALRGGGELSPNARAVIPHLYPLGYQLDETSFGSKSARRAGESWSVDPVSVAQMDSNAIFQIDPETVQGKVTLVGPEKAGNTAGLRLNITLKHCGRDRVPRIVGDTINHQDLAMQIDVLFPLEPALPPLESQIVTDTTATLTRRTDGGNQAKETRVELHTHTVARQTIAPIPK